MDAAGPPLAALDDLGQTVGRDGDPHAGEHPVRVLDGEGEVVGSELDDLIAEASLRQPDRGGRPAEQRHHPVGGDALDDGGEDSQGLVVADEVDVVEDQDEGAAVVEDLEQRRHQLELG